MAEADVTLREQSRASGGFTEQVLDLPLAELERAARGLKFGTVVITYHQGRAIQIERIERKRLG